MIEYKNDDLYNIKFTWQDYIDTVDCSDFIIDFHHWYFKVVESHWTFKKLLNWKSINWTISIKFDRRISYHDAIEYLKEKKLINTKSTILSKRKLRKVKISTLTISHEELTSQRNYDNFAFRRTFNFTQIIWKTHQEAALVIHILS